MKILRKNQPEARDRLRRANAAIVLRTIPGGMLLIPRVAKLRMVQKENLTSQVLTIEKNWTYIFK